VSERHTPTGGILQERKNKEYKGHRDTLERYALQGALLQGISCKEAFWQINFLQISISQGEL
jgi:hypothetical protein